MSYNDKKQASILNFFKGNVKPNESKKNKNGNVEEQKINNVSNTNLNNISNIKNDTINEVNEINNINQFAFKNDKIDEINKLNEFEFKNDKIHEESTEDEILVKKKRKIILDSSSEDININNTKLNNTSEIKLNDKLEDKVDNRDADSKLNNFIFNPEKVCDIKNDDNLIDIQNIQKKKQTNNQRNQEIEQERHKYLNLPISLTNDKFAQYIQQFYCYCNTFEFPKWIDPKYIKDIKLKRPEEPNYDASTMWVPTADHIWAQEYKQPHFTPVMQQYWKIKSKNFDKIIFFKMGRFYEIFYIDACLMHEICRLNWMGNEQKPHIGFPEQSLHFYAKKMIDCGHKVVVIEQMETPKELEQRNKEMGSKDKAIKREINEIYTKGTIVHDNMLNAEARYIICFNFEEYNFGFVISDIATSYISVGHCCDDESRIKLRTILAQICPSEIIYNNKNINKEVLSIFKNLVSNPELTNLNNFPNVVTSMDEINNYFETFPENLEPYKNENSVICAFGGFIIYMRSLLLDKKILKLCKIEKYNMFKKNDYMVLDVTALKHLEILETQSGEVKNSLYDYVNKTITHFGARNMRKWICSPLLDCDKINERLDVVEFLKNNDDILTTIRNRLKKIPDIERLLNKICIQASQSERGAVFFDNIVNTKLKEFVNFLNAFKEIDILLKEINEMEKADNLPLRLFEICNTYDVKRNKDMKNGSYPKIEDITNEFLKKINVVDEKEYKPAEGSDALIDEINAKEKNIKKNLDAILNKIKALTKISSLKYVNAKYKYEIECPDIYDRKYIHKVPNYEITSEKKGFFRVQTDEIKEYVELLDDIEQEKKDAFYPFFRNLFNQFYKYYEQYVIAIRLISELDSLQSFAYVSLNAEYTICRPILHPMNTNVDNKQDNIDKPILILEDNVHPIVAKLIPNFISNNIYMNCDKENKSTLLLTGSNMGGKSTLLRQSAITIILAQIGMFVPCSYCELTIVDKIFSRLGSNDDLFEGKSTFLIELEDISNLLKESTLYSYCILDELGRGTSSFDGTAIALSTLEYISDVIKCRCIFSTHYHLLVDEVKYNDNISNYNMSLNIDKETDQNIIFLYKFVKGVCPRSFGLNIAKLAGIPQEIISLAHDKSLIFEKVTEEFCKIVKYKNIIKILLELNEEKHEDMKSTILQIYNKYKKELI